MSDPKGLLQAVELIHAAALAPQDWPRALAAVAGLTGGVHAVLHAGEPEEPDPPLFAYVGIDPRDLAECMAADQALRSGFTTQYQLPAGPTITRSAVVPDREFERSAYYNEVVRCIDGFHSVYFWQRSTNSDCMVAVCRGRRFDDFGRHEIATLEALRPHFRTAVEFQRRLRIADARSAGLADAFDRLRAGVILTDRHGKPLHVNAPAAAVAAEADGLVLTPAGLAACSPAVNERLRAAIASLAAPAGEIAIVRNGAPLCENIVRLSIARPSGRPPLLLTLLPMERLEIALPGTAMPRVAIFIDEPDAGGGIDRDAVADIFRLTAREADIAVLLAEGAAVVAIARRLGIGAGTVRFHLKNVFAKTDTHSQVALAALVRRFQKHWA